MHTACSSASALLCDLSALTLLFGRTSSPSSTLEHGVRCAGVVFRFIGQWTEQPLLGAKAVAGLLMFATVSGVLMALFLNTAGGAWDNAKKYIEAGHLGGKGGDTHKAAVTGDT